MRSTRICALYCALLISIMQLASGQARTSAPATAHAVVDAEDAGALRSGVVDLQEGVIRARRTQREHAGGRSSQPLSRTISRADR